MAGPVPAAADHRAGPITCTPLPARPGLANLAFATDSRSKSCTGVKIGRHSARSVHRASARALITPLMPPGAHRLLRAAGLLTTPLLPDDYLAYCNPLWSLREPRGRVDAVVPETADSATLRNDPAIQAAYLGD